MEPLPDRPSFPRLRSSVASFPWASLPCPAPASRGGSGPRLPALCPDAVYATPVTDYPISDLPSVVAHDSRDFPIPVVVVFAGDPYDRVSVSCLIRHVFVSRSHRVLLLPQE